MYLIQIISNDEHIFIEMARAHRWVYTITLQPDRYYLVEGCVLVPCMRYVNVASPRMNQKTL